MTSPSAIRNTPEEAAAALRSYRAAANEHARATEQAAEIRYELAEMEQRLSDLEATIVANGGWAGHEITGANESTRKASAAAVISAHAEVQEARHAIRAKKRQLAIEEGAQSEAVNLMRMSRLQVDYQTSWNYRVAAIDDRLPVEVRRFNHGNH